MIRLLGAITGSALALAALLVLVGVPQFKAQPNESEQTLVTLPLRTDRVEAPPDLVGARHAGETEPTPVEAPPAPVGARHAGDTEPDPAQAPPDPVDTDFAPPLQPDTQQWYAFWSPFRSEIAASGFVSQLQRVTGLDYRVVKIKPGVYEVAFAYAQDDDIPVNLSQISAATGLDMPGN